MKALHDVLNKGKHKEDNSTNFKMKAVVPHFFVVIALKGLCKKETRRKNNMPFSFKSNAKQNR